MVFVSTATAAGAAGRWPPSSRKYGAVCRDGSASGTSDSGRANEGDESSEKSTGGAGDEGGAAPTEVGCPPSSRKYGAAWGNGSTVGAGDAGRPDEGNASWEPVTGNAKDSGAENGPVDGHAGELGADAGDDGREGIDNDDIGFGVAVDCDQPGVDAGGADGVHPGNAGFGPSAGISDSGRPPGTPPASEAGTFRRSLSEGAGAAASGG
jgi:hypothetical protein